MADAGPQTRTKTAPWREIKSAIEEVQAMLDAANGCCTEDEVEMMMVEGTIVTHCGKGGHTVDNCPLLGTIPGRDCLVDTPKVST